MPEQGEANKLNLLWFLTSAQNQLTHRPIDAPFKDIQNNFDWILVLAPMYPELTPFLTKHKAEITTAFTTGDEDYRKALLSFINEAYNEFSHYKQFVSAPSPVKITENEIATRAQLLLRARDITQGASSDRRKQLEEDFVKRLVDNFITQTAHEIGDERARATGTTIEKRLRESIATTGVVNILSAARVILETTPEARQVAATILSQTQSYRTPPRLERARLADESAARTVIDNPDFPRPDLLVLITRSQFESLSDSEVINSQALKLAADDSARLTQKATAFSSSVVPDDFGAPTHFFRSYTSGLPKALAPIVDLVMYLLPAKTNTAIAERILTNAWTQTTRHLDKFGEAVTTSPTFRQALAYGNGIFKDGYQTRHGVRSITSLIGDVTTAVFGSPTQTTDDYLRLAIINPSLPDSQKVFPFGSLATSLDGVTVSLPAYNLKTLEYLTTVEHFYLAVSYTSYPHYYTFKKQGTISNIIFTLASNRAITEIAKRAPKLVATGVVAKEGIKKVGLVLAVRTGLVTIFKIASGPIGWAITGLALFGKSIFSFFKSIFKGKLSIATEAISGYLGTLRPPKTQKTDWGLIAALIATGIIVLLVLPLLMVTNRLVGLNQAMGGIINEDTGAPCDPTKDPGCSLVACDPSKQDCRWPTTGCVTQGPLTGGSASHAKLNAVDIGTQGVNGAMVISTIKGVVMTMVTAYIDNSGYRGNTDGGGYGNYIIIEGRDEYAGTTILYGHLSRGGFKVVVGQKVEIGTVVATVDHTGNSSGPHLHYERRSNSGESINRLLPFAIPPCKTALECWAKLNQMGRPRCVSYQ